MKKYRIAKSDKSSSLWIMKERIALIFWKEVVHVSLTTFHLYFKNEEYDMNKFLQRFGLLICVLIGGSLLVAISAVSIPVIGDWLKQSDVDSKWIILSVVLFFGIVASIVHYLQKKDEEWLKQEESEELGYYKED